MTAKKKFYAFLPDGVSFSSAEAVTFKRIYAPLCGTTASSIKSAITPFLSGDIKVDKNHFLTAPMSREDLRQEVRNFFVKVKGKGVVSFVEENGTSTAHVEIGPLWHKLVSRHPRAGIEMTALNFVPVSGEAVELMRVTVKNISRREIRLTPTAAVPIFGRAMTNKHDHEHVTSLLHRTHQLPDGVLVEPTMSFDERGHKPADSVYFVFGWAQGEKRLAGTFPTMESFFGESGTIAKPEAVLTARPPKMLSAASLQGKEACGALRFAEARLKPGQSKEYLIMIGMAKNSDQAKDVFKNFKSVEQIDAALAANQEFWRQKTSAIEWQTDDKDFNGWIKWVTLQPVFRRIFGCSFLPDHDYGKGGKGWRDIWQDLLSLILIEPEHIRPALVNNFAGVRIDGSNATIIGAAPGEFIADRDAITRVWMDHGVWPFLTTLLYINQTGDYDLLLEKIPYFRDPQLSRGYKKDWAWTSAYGNKLKTEEGQAYEGTVIEHILTQHLVQFFNVGEHNIIRLESADWNDGLDMAFARGESVAFMSLYAGNLLSIADLLVTLAQKKGQETILLAKELMILLDTLGETRCDYTRADAKRRLFFDHYLPAVEPEISGEQVEVNLAALVKDLREKGNWIFDHIRGQEKVRVKKDGREYTWFNGYYDNQGERVEGERKGVLRMTLTGQVFPIMSGLASPAEIDQVVASAEQFLRDKKLGGYRLNTDFGMRHYLDLGRAFSFAYGTKENGAFFSHMTVMYAYGLYRRGFVRQGFEVLWSIYQMSRDPARAKIYPGVPEYFDAEGRGMYHYLTGSASWFILTLLTEVFGVRGEGGDLLLSPKLVKEEFGKTAKASVACTFAEKRITVTYHNPRRLHYDKYRIQKVSLNGSSLEAENRSGREVKISRRVIEEAGGDIQLVVELGA